MARRSTKEHKNIYQRSRENLGLSRDAAAELLESIPADRIERIENGNKPPYPDEVLIMAEKYKVPSLCNHYCSEECPIGQEYVPAIEIKSLSQITLEMLATINQLSKEKDRLIEITVDGHISEDELPDFLAIHEHLDQMAITINTLKLWVEESIAAGTIDRERFDLLSSMQE